MHQSLDGHEQFLTPVPVQCTSKLKAHAFLSDHSSLDEVSEKLPCIGG